MDNPRQRRLYTLDAMRGAAALVVALFHCEHIGIALVPSGFLAVDFFFALSGLVIGNAYSERIATGRVGTSSFFISRVVRLYPLYLIGSLLGLWATIAGIPLSSGPEWTGYVATYQTTSAALMLPNLMPAQTLYPLNPPAWSIFFEIVINVIFALILCRLRTKLLVAVLAIQLCHIRNMQSCHART